MPTPTVVSFREYDSDQIRVTGWTQQLVKGMGISGLADGLFLEIDPIDQSFGYKVGTDGSVTRYKKNNFMMKAILHVMQSNAETNGFLSNLVVSDEQAKNGAGVGNFNVEDLAGTSLLICTYAWVAGLAGQKFQREPEERAWEIHMIRSQIVIGGN